MKSDRELLDAYARTASEVAFHELVERYTDLVYSAAFRMLGSPDLAKDVSQAVFIDLARKASSLTRLLRGPADNLVGWLYRSTRYAAMNQLRTDRRRAMRERHAMEIAEESSGRLEEPGSIDFVLDHALADLNESDREILLQRFFANQNFKDLGRNLGLSDDAAQKRVSRALEKLRSILARRGMATSSAGLAAALAAMGIQKAPAGCALVLSSTALAAVPAAGFGSSAVLAFTTMTTSKIITGTALAAALALSSYQFIHIRSLESENRRLRDGTAAKVQSPAENSGNRVSRGPGELERLRKSEADLKEQVALLKSKISGRQQLAEENQELKATIQRQAPANNVMQNAMTQGIETANRYKREQIKEMMPRIKAKCQLTDSQEQALLKNFLSIVDEEGKITLKIISGNMEPADMEPSLQGLKLLEQSGMSLLSESQRLALEEFFRDNAIESAQKYADTETQQLQNDFGLDPAVADRARQALKEALTIDSRKQWDSNAKLEQIRKMADKSLDPFEFAANQMEESVELKIRALKPILTAEQLAKYREKCESYVAPLRNLSPKKK